MLSQQDYTKVVKLPWTMEEDQILREHVEIHGTKNWKFAADKLPNRMAKQCQERYRNVLATKKQKWTPEEDQQIISLYKEFGPRWVLFQEYMTNRSQNQIKNRFNQRLIKQFDAISDSGSRPFIHVNRKNLKRKSKELKQESVAAICEVKKEETQPMIEMIEAVRCKIPVHEVAACQTEVCKLRRQCKLIEKQDQVVNGMYRIIWPSIFPMAGKLLCKDLQYSQKSQRVMDNHN